MKIIQGAAGVLNLDVQATYIRRIPLPGLCGSHRMGYRPYSCDSYSFRHIARDLEIGRKHVFEGIKSSVNKSKLDHPMTVLAES